MKPFDWGEKLQFQRGLTPESTAPSIRITVSGMERAGRADKSLICSSSPGYHLLPHFGSGPCRRINFAVMNPAADKLKITVTPSTGVFKGTFIDAAPGVKGVSTIVTGVLFQAGADGAGFFSGTDGAGAVTITQ